MKTLLLILTALIATAGHSQTRLVNKKTFKLTVEDTSGMMYKGYLITVSDSSLSMLKTPIVFDEGLYIKEGTTHGLEAISKVSYTRKGAVGRGIAIGAASGAVIGLIAGAIAYEKPTPCDPQSPFCLNLDFGAGFDAMTGAAIGTLGGAMIGGIIGAVAKKTFIIGGRKEDFKRFQVNVLDKAYGTSRIQTLKTN